MAALYWSPPTPDQLARTPWYKKEDYKEPTVEVWPENWDALRLFSDNSTQWRTGPNGPAGLDYGVFFQILDRKRLTDEEYEAMLDQLRVIEIAALKAMREDN